MDNFLAIDTSGGYLCVTAVKNGRAFSVVEPDCAMRHSVLLIEKIDEALKKAELSPNDCEAFVACVGAGSFTGIRIGISAVKGFASALGKRAVGVTSFEISAYNTLNRNGKKVLSLVDAGHGYYYACGFEKGEISFSPAYISESEVLKLVGEGYTLRACATLPIEEKVSVEKIPVEEGLWQVAKYRLETGTAQEPIALYVRKSSAEENLAKEKNA